MVLPMALDLDMHRGVQTALLTDVCTLVRAGVVVGEPSMRVGSERQFIEPADPQDASDRAMVVWGFTFEWDEVVEVGDMVLWGSPEQASILGEVLRHNTWQVGTRAFGSKPKLATQPFELVLWRWNPVTEQNDIELPAQTVKLIWDRTAPIEAPLRYAPAGRSSYQGGKFVKEDIATEPFDVQVRDTFFLDGYSGLIQQVLSNQPQVTEASFIVNVGSYR